MQRHPEITLQRLKNFKESKGFKGLIYPQAHPLELTVYHAPARITYEEAVKGEFEDIQVGAVLGPAWSTHWFRVRAEIPDNWDGKEVYLLWDSSSEACVWDKGNPRQGLTGSGNVAWDTGMSRVAYRIDKSSRAGEVVDLYVEVACNGLFGTQPGEQFPLKMAEIAVFDRDAWDLYWDFVVIADIAEIFPTNLPRAGQAMWAANEMINVFNKDDRDTWNECRGIAAKFLSEHNGDAQHNLSAVGYAHLDTAWLWPLEETIRKAVRTFSTTMRLMEDYPDYKFASAQAQHMAWMKDLHPDLYRQIKKRIKEGRFIIVGGCWVEPDCNIPSGESLVRQFLHGQRYYQEEFGFRCKEFWNPDVFGYSGALPQILRGCGMEYFLTQKLSWNQINKPANHTFLWEGIDGSQVLTHFPPADTYGSAGNVRDVYNSVAKFKEHDRSRESILIFGWGDGGGGPTPAMIEQLSRMDDVDGLPRTKIRDVQDFFTRCNNDILDPVVWVGELYFEYHRGTYTTQAANKRDNRKSEQLLRDVELISSLSKLNGEFKYPSEELDGLWKIVLTNQFHDILPGSSINEVYRDSDRDYEKVLTEANTILNESLNQLLSPGDTLVALNTVNVKRVEVIEVPELPGATQKSASGNSLVVVDVQGLGVSRIESQDKQDRSVRLEITLDGFDIENDFLKVTVNQNGTISSLYDKRYEREAVVEAGAANKFVLFEDDPINFEAWDVDVYHLEKPLDEVKHLSSRVLESGPLRVSIEFEYAIGKYSRLVQTFMLTAISPRIDFGVWADWHEEKKFLKVEFPWDIRSETATYEIQFGHVVRPTHFNTTWDLAKFEVCAHRWADFSEPGFGVAVLNDCKYGYSTHRNTMRLSLLRSPKLPDPEADMGEHTFKYAVFPHGGDFRDAGVIGEGYCFNIPIKVTRTKEHDIPSGSYFSVDHPAIVIDTVKKAEDSNDLIIRLYESFGGRCSFNFNSLLKIKSVIECNMLEDELKQLEWSEQGVRLSMKPFEIKTLKLAV